MKSTFLLPALLITAMICDGSEITEKEFPSVAANIDFFEDRMNSASAEVRLGALSRLLSFRHDPSDEFVRFLRRMTQDSDPRIRGEAVNKLHRMFIEIDIADVPQPIGWYAGGAEDLSAKETRQDLLRGLESGSTAGSTPYFVGLLKMKEALPLLRKNGQDLTDVMGLCVTGRALLDCGDAAEAAKLWRRVISQQRQAYANDGPVGNSPYYFVEACRGLIHAGERYRMEGLRELAQAMQILESSDDPNSQHKAKYAQMVFATATREWVDNSGEALRYLKELQTKSNKPQNP